MHTSFTDELYDAALATDYREQGLLWLPWAGAGYAYTFARKFEVGLFAKYRYQKEARKLSPGLFDWMSGNTSNGNRELEYNFKGIDVSLSISAYLLRRSGEK